MTVQGLTPIHLNLVKLKSMKAVSKTPTSRQATVQSRTHVKLPFLQSAPMSLFRHLPTCHLDIRRLHVLLRQFCANLLVRLGIGLFTVA